MSNPYGVLPGVMGEFSEVEAYWKICDPSPPVDFRQVTDALAEWFEFGFTAPGPLTGNAATGWVDADGKIGWEIQSSYDLETWTNNQMIDCAVTAINNGDGTWTYWGRRTVPLVWMSVLIDEVLVSDRYGKSITGINLFRSAVSLPNYPYAMPSQASTLQADLRAAGYTGATVTSTSAALTAEIYNHRPDGRRKLPVTQSGASVTAVTPFGESAISLPSYPYALPSQAATLQADLRTAGYSGAVVMLYKDPWTITIPNLSGDAHTREFFVEFTPGDPYPVWDFYGTYLGLSPATVELGTFNNVRDPLGNPIDEDDRAFFRVHRYGLPI